VDQEKQVVLNFNHASDYVIVFADESMETLLSSKEETSTQENKVSEDIILKTQEKTEGIDRLLVVFIVIMNTLIVSVIERTSEIGTMKALGASRSFIKKLFFIEAISISVIASLLGIIIALVLCGVLNACDITIANDNVKVILGSGVIGFIPKFGSILGTFIAIVAGSAFANLYPVSLALRITPLKAMNQE
jgi:ABC-type antimicrobial peptide transport system permease subunit